MLNPPQERRRAVSESTGWTLGELDCCRTACWIPELITQLSPDTGGSRGEILVPAKSGQKPTVSPEAAQKLTCKGLKSSKHWATSVLPDTVGCAVLCSFLSMGVSFPRSGPEKVRKLPSDTRAPGMGTGPAFTAGGKSRVLCEESSVAILPGTKFTSEQKFTSKLKHPPPCQQQPVTNSFLHRARSQSSAHTKVCRGLKSLQSAALTGSKRNVRYLCSS